MFTQPGKRFQSAFADIQAKPWATLPFHKELKWVKAKLHKLACAQEARVAHAKPHAPIVTHF
jgi:hypothetical protein